MICTFGEGGERYISCDAPSRVAFTYSAKTDYLVRELARRNGWTHKDGKDYCRK